MADGVIRNVSGATRIEHWADLYTRVNARGGRLGAFRNGVNVTSSWGPLSEDMSFVDHIEFVKGPAGFMMSNGEPSGIYNVVTKKPTGVDFKGEANLLMGSYDFYRAALDLDGKLNKSGKLLYRLNLMGQTKGSFRPFEYNDRYAIAPVLTYKIDDQTTLTAEYTYQHAKMSDVGSAYSFSPTGYATLPRNFTTLDPGIEPTNINDHSLFLNLQHQISAGWKLTVQGSYFNYRQQGTSLWPSTVNADGTIIRSVGIWDAASQYRFGQAYINGDFKTGSISHKILGGLDLGSKNYIADWWQSHNLDLEDSPFNPFSNEYALPGNGYPIWNRDAPLEQRALTAHINQNYTGLYLQDELGFADNRVRLTLAGRYTYAKDLNYTTTADAKKFTPRVGLSVSIFSGMSAYALYDQSFVPQAGFLRSGDNPQPITGSNGELGLKKDWFDGKWSTTVSVYRIIKNNELTSDPNNDASQNEQFSVIIGKNKAQGVEFDMKGELIPGLNLVANYAYTDAKVMEVTPGVEGIAVGNRIPGFARHNANAWITYKISKGALKGAGIAAGFNYQVDRDSWSWASEGLAKLPDYFRLDGGLFWEKDKIRLTANVYNILNKYLYSGGYEGWASPSYYSYQVEAPANFKFGIAYKF
jgi:iron complex outermembrane receptor protein